MKENSNNIIHKEGDWKIYKNPECIFNFGPDVRGVILRNGNLYLESLSEGTMHSRILRVLYGLDILKGSYREGWSRRMPDLTGFLTVQRIDNSWVMAIGESNQPLYSTVGFRQKMYWYNVFLERAQKKNSGVMFQNTIIRINPYLRSDANRAWLNDEDISKM